MFIGTVMKKYSSTDQQGRMNLNRIISSQSHNYKFHIFGKQQQQQQQIKQINLHMKYANKIEAVLYHSEQIVPGRE